MYQTGATSLGFITYCAMNCVNVSLKSIKYLIKIDNLPIEAIYYQTRFLKTLRNPSAITVFLIFSTIHFNIIAF